MEWKGDEENEPVPVWRCNLLFTRRKPSTASNNQSHNRVHTGIIWILYVFSIYISQWCNIELPGERVVSFSHLQRCFLPWASWERGESQSQCPENRTREEAKGRRWNQCWHIDTIQEVALDEGQVGCINYKIDISMEFDANIKCLKIHLVSHWAEQIHRYGALQQYSAQRHEQTHKTTSRTVGMPRIAITTTCHK